LRYGNKPKNFPEFCDGCEKPFDIDHAMNCKVGGNVKHGHDQLRDECAALAEMAWGGVRVEPFLKDQSGNYIPGSDLRADFMVRGVWERQRIAFFDNRILDADAPSRFHRNMHYETALRSAVREKKRLYGDTCEDLRASFTPLVCTVDGVCHREFIAFQKRLASRLATKWQEAYSKVMNWVRVRIQFALIRAIDLRLRGNRKKIHSFGFEDGAGLGLVWN